jgi:hypothetical protein
VVSEDISPQAKTIVDGGLLAGMVIDWTLQGRLPVIIRTAAKVSSQS